MGFLIFHKAYLPVCICDQEPGVSGNSRLPYKFVGISHEIVRQKGIPAHPCQEHGDNQVTDPIAGLT